MERHLDCNDNERIVRNGPVSCSVMPLLPEHSTKIGITRSIDTENITNSLCDWQCLETLEHYGVFSGILHYYRYHYFFIITIIIIIVIVMVIVYVAV